MLIRSPNGTYEAIDFRETAPQAAFEDMYKNNEQASLTGGLASGVPGELRGLQYLHENYGKLSWADVLAPGAKLAREGWLVNEDLVKYMKSATNNVPESNTTNFLVHDPQWAMDFAPKGRLLKINETITRKRYAATIETIAQHGPDAFYTGPIADATIRALRAKNGTMTMDDLKNYTIARRPAASITYGDFKLSSVPAPSSGNVMLAVLKTMSGYAAHEAGVNTTTHRLDEAMRFAYGQRSKLGDPSFVEGLDTFQEQMLSDETAAEIRGKISDTKAYEVPYYQPEGLESLDTPGTSHISTADKDGLAVSLTTTVNLLFGSKLVVPETGVIMNNEMNVSSSLFAHFLLPTL
ncbi:gamma-glutamyltranspeptidase [Sporormia fimetaria CBS 119925]|uniref:Gamma-glutamyltranspeptidase n=1 Tax=Sporormia fimetaria CBS 119925 TaxID=1340428 RepID=A0A6A6VGY6_9PLEO|nr:gamma-glutamyltranspeptidase [Sporormia fimetaria CBS 119925]